MGSPSSLGFELLARLEGSCTLLPRPNLTLPDASNEEALQHAGVS